MKKEIKQLKTFEDWKEHGIKQGYEKKNPTSLAKSPIKEEMRWFYRGRDKKWLKDFEFKRKYQKPNITGFLINYYARK